MCPTTDCSSAFARVLLLQTVAGAPDVRPVLERRFGMLNWFKRHGYPDSLWQQPPPQQAVRKAGGSARAAPVPHPSAPVAADQAADLQVVIEDVVDQSQTPLLVFDFDKTISAWDAGEHAAVCWPGLCFAV